MAAEAWWRAAALAALAAFTAGPAAAAPRAEGAALHRAAAGLLAGTLDAVSSAPSLQDPARTGARAGPGGVYAAAAAMLQVGARAVLRRSPPAGAAVLVVPHCWRLPGAAPGLVPRLEGSCRGHDHPIHAVSPVGRFSQLATQWNGRPAHSPDCGRAAAPAGRIRGAAGAGRVCRAARGTDAALRASAAPCARRRARRRGRAASRAQPAGRCAYASKQSCKTGGMTMHTSHAMMLRMCTETTYMLCPCVNFDV